MSSRSSRSARSARLRIKQSNHRSASPNCDSRVTGRLRLPLAQSVAPSQTGSVFSVSAASYSSRRRPHPIHPMNFARGHEAVIQELSGSGSSRASETAGQEAALVPGARTAPAHDCPPGLRSLILGHPGQRGRTFRGCPPPPVPPCSAGSASCSGMACRIPAASVPSPAGGSGPDARRPGLRAGATENLATRRLHASNLLHGKLSGLCTTGRAAEAEPDGQGGN